MGGGIQFVILFLGGIIVMPIVIFFLPLLILLGGLALLVDLLGIW